MSSSLDTPETRLHRVISSWGTPAEQVSLRPRSCAPVVENCRFVQAQVLAREVGAGAGISVWAVDLLVDGKAVHQQFCLESKPMPWGGGVKFFFHCGCGRRCAKLYLPSGGDQFACRSCHRLLYWDQRYKTRRATM